MEWSASTASPLASFGGVVQRSLDDGCGVMDLHRVGALSGAMVASMADLPGVMRSSTLKMGQRLMAVTASVASAQGARRGSTTPDECSYFAIG